MSWIREQYRKVKMDAQRMHKWMRKVSIPRIFMNEGAAPLMKAICPVGGKP